MCLPAVAVGIISAIASVAGTATTVVGSVVSGSAQAKAGEEAERQAQENAYRAKMAGGDAMSRGAIAAGEVRAEGGRIVGEQRTIAAASGVDTGTGTALDLQTKTRQSAEAEAGRVLHNAQREAWGYSAEAAEMKEAGARARRQGYAARDASMLGGAAQLASGFAQAAGTTYGLMQDRKNLKGK